MADKHLEFSGYKPQLPCFSGDSNPEIWIFEAERYFNFYGIRKDIWLSLPYIYFVGEARAWFDWLYDNNQFFNWKHFTEKLAYHYRKNITPDLSATMESSFTDLLLIIDENLSLMRRRLDNFQKSVSEKFAQVHVSSTAVTQHHAAEIADSDTDFDLHNEHSISMDNSKVLIELFDDKQTNTVALTSEVEFDLEDTKLDQESHVTREYELVDGKLIEDQMLDKSTQRDPFIELSPIAINELSMVPFPNWVVSSVLVAKVKDKLIDGQVFAVILHHAAHHRLPSGINCEPHIIEVLKKIIWFQHDFNNQLNIWCDTGQRLTTSKSSLVLFVIIMLDIYMYVKIIWLDRESILFDKIIDELFNHVLESHIPLTTEYISSSEIIFELVCLPLVLWCVLLRSLMWLASLLRRGAIRRFLVVTLALVHLNCDTSFNFTCGGWILIVFIYQPAIVCSSLTEAGNCNFGKSTMATQFLLNHGANFPTVNSCGLSHVLYVWDPKSCLGAIFSCLFVETVIPILGLYAHVPENYLVLDDWLLVALQTLRDSIAPNLEDKVLIEDGGIVMNYLMSLGDGLENNLGRSPTTKQSNKRLIWDPGPARDNLKRVVRNRERLSKNV